MKAKIAIGQIIGTVIPADIAQWEITYRWGEFRCREIEGKWVVEEKFLDDWKPIIIGDSPANAIRQASESVRSRGY